MILSNTFDTSLAPTNGRQAVIAESINELSLQLMGLLKEYASAQNMLTFDDWKKTTCNSYRHIAVPCGHYGLTEPPINLSCVRMFEVGMFEKGQAPMIIKGARENQERRRARRLDYHEEVIAKWALAKKFTAFTSNEIDDLVNKVRTMFPKRNYMSLFAFGPMGQAEKINYYHGIDRESMTFLFKGRLMRVKGETKQERETRRDMMLFSLKTANKLKKNRPLSIAA